MNSARRLDVVLYATCSVLAGGFSYEVWAPLGEPTVPVVAVPERPALATIAPFNPPPQSSFSAIDARPIFSPARKPIESTAVTGNSTTAAPPDVVLIGVILDGKTQLALLKREGAPFAESTGVGATVDGWEITEIGPNHVVMRSGAQDFVLSMDGKRKTQPSQPEVPSAKQPGAVMSAPFARQPTPRDQVPGAGEPQHPETTGEQ
jgi:hypothetical protein